MEPDRTKGIKFGDYQPEDRTKAQERLHTRRLSAQERHNLEAQRTQEYNGNTTAAEKYQLKREALPKTFREWNELRRTDKAMYHKLSSQMIRDRELLGDAFYDQELSGQEALQHKLTEVAPVETKRSIFDEGS